MSPCEVLAKAGRRFSRTVTSAISLAWFLTSLKRDRACGLLVTADGGPDAAPHNVYFVCEQLPLNRYVLARHADVISAGRHDLKSELAA